MTLTITEREMHALLSDRPQRTGHLGATLWARKSHVSRTPSAYARPAGKVLRALERKGLAAHVFRGEDDYGWVATFREVPR